MKSVTTKEMYVARMEDMLNPPKVEIKFPGVNFQELVYPRINNTVLEVKQRYLLFSLVQYIPEQAEIVSAEENR